MTLELPTSATARSCGHKDLLEATRAEDPEMQFKVAGGQAHPPFILLRCCRTAFYTRPDLCRPSVVLSAVVVGQLLCGRGLK